jgi:hypothetical protein
MTGTYSQKASSLIMEIKKEIRHLDGNATLESSPVIPNEIFKTLIGLYHNRTTAASGFRP